MQVLIYTTKQLSSDKDGYLLKDFGIKNLSTIMLVLRLLGGAPLELRVLVNSSVLKLNV